MSFVNRVKDYFHKLLSESGSPHSIAMGFAIGTFIAMLPTFSFGFVVGLLVLLIFPRLNKYSLMSAFVIWNVFTLAPFYTAGYNIGDWIFGPFVETINAMWYHKVYDFARKILIGNIIVGSIMSTVFYVLIRLGIYAARKDDSEEKETKE